jgi:hypothetical protein
MKEIFALMSDISFPKWLDGKQLEEGIKNLKDLAQHFLEAAK